ncbi:DUF2523 domain-containing protein [Halomonas sp. ML-15]|uniref:DUF2523 domain-containing protein n=1 Tax=Halomonas sp. ML-15 TaxID=2773305 RepID=UPI001745FC83|nr:DUF2523 domain-containing protein [Halomonas sp. ML-15]MBD3896596.1 DUF2523 domain-containing protein [Halomonas sp. ML-15]
MPAVIVTILAAFAKFFIAVMVAKIATFLVFTTISTVLIRNLMDAAMNHLGSVGEFLWFAQLAGIDVALSAIGSAFLLRAAFRAWSVGPSAIITGG